MNLLLISMKFCRIMISCLTNRSSHRNIISYIESMSRLHLNKHAKELYMVIRL